MRLLNSITWERGASFDKVVDQEDYGSLNVYIQDSNRFTLMDSTLRDSGLAVISGIVFDPSIWLPFFAG